MTRLKKDSLPFTILFNLLIIAVILILGELGFVLFADHLAKTPDQLRASSLEYAPSIFSCHAFPQKEKNARISPTLNYHINAQGYRGESFSPDKPEGAIRVIFYGGSQVFDSWADLAGDWPHGIGYILKKEGMKNLEIINAGTPGHATFDSLGRFLSEGHRFRPDFVVLCHGWNDIKYFSKSIPILRQFHPYEPADDPRLYYQNAMDRLLGDHSRLYLYLRSRYYRYKLKLAAEGRMDKNDFSGKIQPEALAQFRLTVATFVDLVRNAGAVPILITQPRLVAPNNTARQWKRIGYGYTHFNQDNLLEAYRQTDEILHDVAAEKQVDLIDASTPLTGKDRLFFDHVHFSHVGSRIMAQITAQRLKEIIKRQEAAPSTGRAVRP